MGLNLRRSLLFVVDEPEPAVQLVASLFGRSSCTLALKRDGHHDSGWQAAHALTRLLRRDGYEVGLVVAGDDAKRRLSQGPAPDALIADVGSSGGACLSVARHARRLYPNLPLLFVSTYPELLRPGLAQLSPRPLVFAKPLDYEEFALELRRAARKHSGEFVRVPLPFAANDRESWPGGS